MWFFEDCERLEKKETVAILYVVKLLVRVVKRIVSDLDILSAAGCHDILDG